MDLFMGSGTALFECERLSRNYIGFDINEEIIRHVRGKMEDCDSIQYFINDCDVCSPLCAQLISDNLKQLGKRQYDFLLIHPPYWDIVKFTENSCDLSKDQGLNSFIKEFIKGFNNAFQYLKSGKHFALVIGDLYRDSEVIPLGFYLMYVIRKSCKCKLKGIVVKDIVGNRGKSGQEALWRYRTLKSDTFLFKHEYIFVFKKG